MAAHRAIRGSINVREGDRRVALSGSRASLDHMRGDHRGGFSRLEDDITTPLSPEAFPGYLEEIIRQANSNFGSMKYVFIYDYLEPGLLWLFSDLQKNINTSCETSNFIFSTFVNSRPC